MRAGLDQAIARGISYAAYADMVWCETSEPNLSEAKRFAEAVKAKFPDKLLAYNCSPSFNWKKKTRQRDDREVSARARRDGIQISIRHARRVSTRSTTACFGSRTATKSAAWRRIRNYRKRSSRPRAMVTLRPNISAKSAPVTSMKWLRSSRAGNLNHRFARLDGTGAVSLSRPRMSLTSSPISPERGDLTDSRLAALCAETVQHAFLEYEERFRAITLRARERFLARDWRGSYADAAERLRLYARQMETLTEQIKEMMGTRLSERSVWAGMKAVYSSLIAQSPKREIAESFFNSLTRRVFATEGVDQAIEFVDTDFDEAPTTAAR